MAKPIDEMKSDYMTKEQITTKLRADGLEDYLEFKSNGDYDYLECEYCDGPMLGHKAAECRYGQWYDETTRRKFKKWLDRIPELRRLLEIREATTETSRNDEIKDNRSRMDEWINQLQLSEERKSESRSGCSRTTSRERDRRDSSQLSRRSSSRLTSRPDRIRSRSRDENPEKGAKERERSVEKPESDLEKRVEGLKKEIDEIKKNIGGISRIEEILKNAMIGAQCGGDEISIDVEYDMAERIAETKDSVIRDATKARSTTQYDDQDEALAPSPTTEISTNCATHDRGSQNDDRRSRLQSREYRRSEKRPRYFRTARKRRQRHGLKLKARVNREMRNSSETIWTSKMDETVDSLIDDEMVLETEKLEMSPPRTEHVARAQFEEESEENSTIGTTDKSRPKETCDDRCQIDEWRSRFQSREHRKYENRPRYFRTARKRRQRHGLKFKARVKRRQIYGSSYLGERNKQKRDTTEKARASETDKTVDSFIDDETILETAKLEMVTPRGEPIARAQIGEKLEERWKRETTERPWIKEIIEENSGTPTIGKRGEIRERKSDGKSRPQSRRERRSKSRPGYSRTASRERNIDDSPQLGGRDSSRQIVSPDRGGNQIKSRSRGRSPENRTKERRKSADKSKSDLTKEVEKRREENEAGFLVADEKVLHMTRKKKKRPSKAIGKTRERYNKSGNRMPRAPRNTGKPHREIEKYKEKASNTGQTEKKGEEKLPIDVPTTEVAVVEAPGPIEKNAGKRK